MTMTDIALRAPRILGVGLAAFLTLFAFDSFDEVLPLPLAILGVVLHLLPSAIVLVLVGIGSHWPFAGAMGFFGVAALYAYAVPQGRADWIAAVSGPLMIVGAAFLWSWLRQPPDGEAAEAR